MNDPILRDFDDPGGFWKHKTKKVTVIKALIEYIERREQKKIAELFGTIEYDETYIYKSHRSCK